MDESVDVGAAPEPSLAPAAGDALTLLQPGCFASAVPRSPVWSCCRAEVDSSANCWTWSPMPFRFAANFAWSVTERAETACCTVV